MLEILGQMHVATYFYVNSPVDQKWDPLFLVLCTSGTLGTCEEGGYSGH